MPFNSQTIYEKYIANERFVYAQAGLKVTQMPVLLFIHLPLKRGVPALVGEGVF